MAKNVNPWWYVDLGKETWVRTVVIVNRVEQSKLYWSDCLRRLDSKFRADVRHGKVRHAFAAIVRHDQ
jgi:hypothetical protein